MSRPFRACLVLLLVAVPCRTALAEVIHVPKDHATIQSAVNVAADGDTIAIKGGVYPESVVVSGRSNLVLLAKGKVVLDPPGVEDGLTIENCTDVSVVRMRVTGAVNGIVFNGCLGGDVFKCRVEEVSGAGIVVDDSEFVFVEKCFISDIGGTGVSLGLNLPSDHCDVLLTKIFRAGGNGIEVSGDNNSIESNRIFDATGDGIRTAAVPVSNVNSIVLNRVLHPGGHGFVLGGDDNELFVNRVVQPGGHGVQVTSGTGSVIGFCRVVKPGQGGLFGEATANGVSVFMSRFIKPGTNGVVIGGDGSFVTDCRVAGAQADGYVVDGDNGWWNGNRAAGSGDDGFQLTGTSNTFIKNKAHGSKGGFDLNDLSGGDNSIDETNKFKTQAP